MRKVKLLLFLLMSLAILSVCGCTFLNEENEGEYKLYYTNFEVTGLESEGYDAAGTAAEELIPELLGALGQEPKNNKHFVLLSDPTIIEKYEFDGSTVTLFMDRRYNEMPKTKEILVRAGLVRTLVQIEAVNSVQIYVNGVPLTNSKGEEIGQMDARTFIENSGKEINNYKKSTVRLYFTNAEGNRLVEEKRQVHYSSNVPLEQIIVEHLIQGPKVQGDYPTLPSNASVLSVTIVDKICYVNFNKNFLTNALNIQQDIPIYSISQSLMENCDIEYVQISVNGNSDLIFRESMPLNQYYEKNHALVLTEPEVTPESPEMANPGTDPGTEGTNPEGINTEETSTEETNTEETNTEGNNVQELAATETMEGGT